MDFCEAFPRLEPVQQERFAQVVTRLLSGDILTPGSALRPDGDWLFAERHRDLVDSYLRIGGWRLDIDLGLRLCRAMHESGKQRVRFSKFESLVLCVLRLVYHEQMQQVRDEERCDLSVGELRERLIQSGKPASQVTRRAIEVALRRLAKHGLVDIERGFTAEDVQRILVEPVIERVLPPDRIADIASKVRTYTGLGISSADVATGDAEPSTEDLDDPEEVPT